MNANQDPDKSANLEKLLKQWVVDTPVPPMFQEQVWNRISRAEARSDSAKTFWGLLRSFFEANLPRPKVALSYVALLLLFGIVSGTWAAQHERTRLNAALGSAYVQSVDPYQKVVFNQ